MNLVSHFTGTPNIDTQETDYSVYMAANLRKSGEVIEKMSQESQRSVCSVPPEIFECHDEDFNMKQARP